MVNGKTKKIRCIGCKSTKTKIKATKTTWICSLCCKGVLSEGQYSKCFAYHLDNLCEVLLKGKKK